MSNIVRDDNNLTLKHDWLRQSDRLKYHITFFTDGSKSDKALRMNCSLNVYIITTRKTLNFEIKLLNFELKPVHFFGFSS